MAQVRDHIPLEQGLRPTGFRRSCRVLVSQRPYSIRTRIKTSCCSGSNRNCSGQRPYSIRTRIKTYFTSTLQLLLKSQRPYSIRTRIKTSRYCYHSSNYRLRQRPYSIRTRIKTFAFTLFTNFFESETIFH